MKTNDAEWWQSCPEGQPPQRSTMETPAPGWGCHGVMVCLSGWAHPLLRCPGRCGAGPATPFGGRGQWRRECPARSEKQTTDQPGRENITRVPCVHAVETPPSHRRQRPHLRRNLPHTGAVLPGQKPTRNALDGCGGLDCGHRRRAVVRGDKPAQWRRGALLLRRVPQLRCPLGQVAADPGLRN